MVVIILLLLAAAVLINYSPVQNFLSKKAAGYLSDKLNTKVDVANVRIGFLNKVLIQGVYVEGQAKDTLLYAGELQISITDWFIFKDKPVLHYLGLENTYVHLYRNANSSVWNYDFILDAFTSPAKKNNKNSQAIEFDLKKIKLENVRFHMDDKWVGSDMDYDIGYLIVNSDGIDFAKKRIDLDDIQLLNTSIFLDDYVGGRPRRTKTSVDTFDTTPFNTDGWGVSVKNISIGSCSFNLRGNSKIPIPGLFDENHLEIRKIAADIANVQITGDTITGSIDAFTAIDRCGLAIKAMRSVVSVSPVATICKDLYLETNHSILKDYYAMHYSHFPAFLEYIDSVTMVAHLSSATIDKRDIMFFAPELADLPDIKLTVSGDGKGQVSNLSSTNLNVSDGHIAARGNVTMKGLPYIYNTYITFTDAELLTTGKGILHYAPGLRDNPNLGIDSISSVYFTGSYTGFIENFRLSGLFKSNLGTVTTDMRMFTPGFKSEDIDYSGVISTTNLGLGRLFRQPMVGAITMDGKITGHSLDPEFAQMLLDGSIKELSFNNYTYHNIFAHGTLARKQFDGNVLIDDPNMALEFDGSLNYEKELVKVNATAHLLGSNFQTLNFTTDKITATADFDLNCTGSSIDNFSGYGKLFNIDLKRNEHRLEIDSVYVQSAGDSSQRRLKIKSDAFTASINGNYRLSNLPASVQYYLSRYIPNYIKAPEKYAPDQDLTFKITTTHINNIFAVTVPLLSGFDSATFSGSLNTSKQKLRLNASIPYGSIGSVYMHNVSIIGEGDLNVIGLNTTIGNIVIGDSILKGELSLTSTVGNDSVSFTLATTGPDKESSLSLNGLIAAYSDTLQVTVYPSQFFMNKEQWDIPGGSSIVFTNNYLDVHNISMSSGLQKITIGNRAGIGQPLVLNAENIDIAQLGNIFGMSSYQPDGRINGFVKVENLFADLLISTNMRATRVKLGADTIGTINIIGSYAPDKKTLKIDGATGIYRDDAYISMAGVATFGKGATGLLDGAMKFNKAKVSWAAPFLAGLISNLSGAVSGTVAIDGTPDKPGINGRLTLTDGTMKLDYMGCNYFIPTASVGVTNDHISLGRIQVYDSYRNIAILSGVFTHDMFDNMRMRLKVTTPKFEVMNLGRNDNELFYGNLIASMDSFTIRGPFNNIRLNLYNGEPAAKSAIYIPASSGGYTGAYNYVSFKTYGTSHKSYGSGADWEVSRQKDQIHINLDANLNTLAEIHIILDPATGDEIVATGSGNLQMDIPPNNDMRLTGLYTIYNGIYTLTFQQVAINRVFRLKQNSTISFNGPFSETNLHIDAVYSVKAKLYDLLTENDKVALRGNTNEITDAQAPQWVNVMLHMNGPIYNSLLTFDIDLEDKHSQGSLAARKLQLINNDDRQKFDNVASLLLVGSFIPSDGMGQQTAISGAINNVSQIISNTASLGLTNIVNKLIGSRDLNVAVKYTNYNYNYGDQALAGNVNRSQLKLGLTKNYLNDRLLVSVGSTSDWGKPSTTSSATNFNFAGDFRLQYLLSKNSGLGVNVFHTSDYDLTRDQNIQRSGFGLSWRKSFDNLGEFFRGSKYTRKLKEKQMQAQIQAANDTTDVPAEIPK